MRERVYRPAWWLPGGHLRTLWGALVRRRAAAVTRRERWETPDGDFLDLYRLDAPADRPRLLMLHGLEGSARSHYAAGLFAEAARRGWAADLLLFRSCGDEPNRLARSYHSGETGDLDFVVRRLVAAEPGRPLLLSGVSLGGNVMLKWLGEQGDAAPPEVRAAAAVSVPYDLARGARHLERGFARVYTWHFLRTLRSKAHAKCERFPGLLEAERIEQARTLREFDDAVTARLHGFRDAAEYYARSSSLGFLPRVRRPTLLLSAVDDPFLPPAVLDEVRALARDNPWLHVEFVARGGHVGFVHGRLPWRPFYWGEWRAAAFLAAQLGEDPR